MGIGFRAESGEMRTTFPRTPERNRSSLTPRRNRAILLFRYTTVEPVMDSFYCPFCQKNIEPEAGFEEPVYIHDDVPHDPDYRFEEMQ